MAKKDLTFGGTLPLWPTVGKALNLGKNGTYAAAKRGEIAGLMKFGRVYRVADAGLQTDAGGGAQAGRQEVAALWATRPRLRRTTRARPPSARRWSISPCRSESGDPAVRHLVDVRGLDQAVVLAHPDLRHLRSPIPLRPKTDAALVALLRPGPGEDPTGAELSFVDHRGAKSATDPARITWSFVEKGCSSAWFWAGGSGDTLVLCEGFGAKALAIASAGVPGVIIGGGSRVWLGNDRQLPPGIKRAVIVADRRPAEGERDADGKPSAERHDRDYRRAADRLLLELGDDAVLITPDPPCGCCKDSDEVLRAHGAEAVRAWVDGAAPAKLSPTAGCRSSPG